MSIEFVSDQDAWVMYLNNQQYKRSENANEVGYHDMQLISLSLTKEVYKEMHFVSLSDIPMGLILDVKSDIPSSGRELLDSCQIRMRRSKTREGVIHLDLQVYISEQTNGASLVDSVEGLISMYELKLQELGVHIHSTNRMKLTGYRQIDIFSIIDLKQKGDLVVSKLFFNRNEFFKSKAETLKENQYDPQVLVEFFNFPKGYESVCSQYLMWFGEFLSNLGIDANVSVENKGEETKIIVAPDEAGDPSIAVR